MTGGRGADDRGRRRPGQRRRYEPKWPANVSGRRRRLGRATLLLGALIAFFGIGFALFSRSAEDGLRLVERDGGWYHPQSVGGQLVPVTPLRVIDGDTFEALAGGTTLVVRIFGVDTRERGERCADEATARLDALVEDRVLLMADERLEDPGGRQLRYVFTPDGRSIDAALIAEGLAEAWRSDGALRDQLVSIEKTARSKSIGCLWTGG